ncbi:MULTISPECIES: hypothetical protein [Arthrobacter]|uniref:ESX secretion-associated protein EspG n=2 Tax=Arthrobacter TaxID=1663 RepID=A0ABU9KIQ3_9MICC|nr:hypothetical protein [Arthrobacter sp. YJM1]MDP5226983.1 hypothetical protein [Arthrobacter sp. YJM1]
MTENLIEFTERDIAAAQSLLARADDSPTLPTLSDEEIVALDGIKHEQVVVLPWLSQHQDQRELLCNVALRTLLTKGIVFPLAESPESAPSGLGTDDELTAVMTLRRTGQRAVIAEVAHGDDDRYWLYSYLHGEFTLQELIDSAGIHSFSLIPTAGVPSSILELAGAPGVESETGEVLELSEADLAALAPTRLADVRAVASVIAVGESDDDRPSLVVYASPNGLDVLNARAAGDEVRLTLSRLSMDDTARALSSLLGDMS